MEFTKKFKKCIFLPIERAGTNKFFGKSCSVRRKKSVQTAHCPVLCAKCGLTTVEERLITKIKKCIFLPIERAGTNIC